MTGFSIIICLATKMEGEGKKHAGTMFAMFEPAIEPFTARIGKGLKSTSFTFPLHVWYDYPNYYAIYNL